MGPRDYPGSEQGDPGPFEVSRSASFIGRASTFADLDARWRRIRRSAVA